MNPYSTPIIFSSDYNRLERKYLDTKEKILEAMEKVALAIVEKILHELATTQNIEDVLLVVGKGNNGADALAIGRHLIKVGIKVVALELFEQGHSVYYQIQKEKFLAARGEIITLEEFQLLKKVVVVDGVFGSGFNGDLDQKIKEVFTYINQSNWKVFSIDAPSGVSGDTGAHPDALQATITFYIDFPRMGFFLDETPNYLGELIPIYIDCIPAEETEKVIQGYLIDKDDLKMPPLKRKQHKYQAGNVVGFVGSMKMSGTCHLAGLAALRVGCGIVKFFHHRKLHFTAPELILFPLKKGKELLKTAKAVMIGPGIGRGLISKWIFRLLLKWIKTPTVFDADALYHLKKRDLKKIPPSILTPHRKECLDLLKLPHSLKDQDLFHAIEDWIKQTPHLFVLKGIPTILLMDQSKKLVFFGGSPGMATAGSGDVLTGMMAGLLAKKIPLVQAASLAVYLHQKAGEIAEKELTAYSITASDLIDRIPFAISLLLEDS